MNKRKIGIVVGLILIIAIAAFIFISTNSQNTKLEITSNSTLKNGDFLSVVLKDEYRNVYPNQVINVKILDDSGWADYYNATTDETGTINILLEGMDNGNYTVHCDFNGTLLLKKSNKVANLEINDGLN